MYRKTTLINQRTRVCPCPLEAGAKNFINESMSHKDGAKNFIVSP